MTTIFRYISLSLLAAIGATSVEAQDTVRYVGKTLVNVDYHHGQLVPVVGVHNRQIFRANREHPEMAEGQGWTYNHAPMLAYWNNRFYVEYLSDSVGESIPPGQTLLMSSKDGVTWTKPDVIFPPYRVPDGTRKPDNPNVAKNLFAVTHQRMGFYVSNSKKLLALAYYGICLDPKDDPNDGNGIGRVVREVLPDGKYGPIYFIRYNHNWNEKNTSYPFYKKSKNKAFVAACDELLASPLITQQWVEEADRDDALIPLKKQYKAFSFYHLPDGRVVGLWKNALTAISNDNGKSWPESAVRAPGFVNGTAKIWGQHTSDGKYATVYNPSEFRWPLAVSTSADGLNYTDLLLVNGEISPMRYGGAYKSYGPQYMRGIIEGNGTPPDGNMWMTYSMNKEDIWVSSIPVPIATQAAGHANEDFTTLPAADALKQWNVYSPLWASVAVDKVNGKQALVLKDSDPYDYARAERIVPASKQLTASFSIIPAQDHNGSLDIEFQDPKGTAGIRVTFDSAGVFTTKAGARYKNFMTYKAGEKYDVTVSLNTQNRFFTINVNGKEVVRSLLFQPLDEVSRIVFRTGGVRRFPDADTPADQEYDLPNGGEKVKEAAYYIYSLKTKTP